MRETEEIRVEIDGVRYTGQMQVDAISDDEVAFSVVYEDRYHRDRRPFGRAERDEMRTQAEAVLMGLVAEKLEG